ncbi:MAG: hypothetical protein HRF43_17595, partial [Phycisphaerae bacterium]
MFGSMPTAGLVYAQEVTSAPATAPPPATAPAEAGHTVIVHMDAAKAGDKPGVPGRFPARFSPESL